MNYFSNIAKLTLSVLALCIVSTDYVIAQDVVLEEIIVTARKRSESLQDVPASVTAFNAQTIEQAGIKSMRDFVGLTTNMTLVETQNIAFSFVNIRGLSTVRNVDPTVAVVVDGVLSTTSLGFSRELYDIQQIEVLKGPQGALYGRNATGGAINITTKQPTDEFESFLRVGAGDGDYTNASAMISGALSEGKVRGRAVIGYTDAEGWRDNPNLGVAADPYEDLTFRGRLLFTPSDSVSIDLRAAYSDTDAGGAQFVSNALAFLVPGNGSAPPVSGIPGFLVPLVGDANNTSVQIDSQTLGHDNREATVVSAKIDWDTGASTLTSITAFDQLDHVTVGDQFAYHPFISPGFFNLTFGQNRFHEGFSQELRLTSSDDQRLRWIIGGYVASTELDTMIAINQMFSPGPGFVIQGTEPNIGGSNPTDLFNNRMIATLVPIVGFPTAVAITNSLNTNSAALSYNLDHAENTTYALFGQINYDISDNFELSFALRYDKDDRELTVRTPQAFLPTFTFPGGATEGEVRKRDFDSLQPKVTLRWQPSDAAMLYAIYSEGFRSGGFNLSGVSAGIQALSMAGVVGLPAGVNDSFEQEDTQSFEFGFKTTTAGGRLNINGSLFQTQIDNAYTFTFVAPLTAQSIRNIKDADITGAEIDAVWLPTDNFQINFGLGLLDTEIKASDWLGTGGINIVGKEIPLNPESTLNLGFVLNIPMGNSDGFIRLDWQRLGKMWFEPENLSQRDELNFVDARAGLNTSNGWEFAIWGKNLTDEDYIAELTNPNGITYYGRLRRYGIEVTKRFGSN
jgi:iron complex outermembrane receptor protein